jgi:alginate O-acetyltransferase complex protein AlgI
LLFNSFEFLFVFLPVVLLIYFWLRQRHRWQNAFLFLASCVFYASWDWRFLIPLVCTTSLDYCVSQQLERLRSVGADRRVSRRYLLVSLVGNLGLLGFFKYFNFFTASSVALLEVIGFDVSVPFFNIVLPIAISFYTFQAMSYTIDVYRGEIHATRSFWDFFLAVLYFPHLVAGPIQRAASLLPQVIAERRFSRQRAAEGARLMLCGYFKKAFIADNLAPIANGIFERSFYSGGSTVVGVLAYSFQIYCDFSGYTDIARGIAKIMGFEFILNFNLPYFATSPVDFWRRWHISLSTWLRDYLYKPLGGNRKGKLKTYRNIMITMLLGGLWHGAAWNFVLWGFYHGVLLIVHRLARGWLNLAGEMFSGVPAVWLAVRIVATFVLTCYGWLLFRSSSLGQIVGMTRSLGHPWLGLDPIDLGKIAVLVLPLLLAQWLQWRSGELNAHRLVWLPDSLKVVGYSLMIYCIVFLGGTPQSFVYFQF